MKFSNKSKYGLAALIDLSVHTKTGHECLAAIAQRNDISQQYLEQIFALLRKAKIVKSVKGPKGGYVLARKAAEISVAEVLEVLEGGYELDAIDTVKDGEQAAIQNVLQEDVVEQVNKILRNYLSSLTLADLEKHYDSINNKPGDMYYI